MASRGERLILCSLLSRHKSRDGRGGHYIDILSVTLLDVFYNKGSERLYDCADGRLKIATRDLQDLKASLQPCL